MGRWAGRLQADPPWAFHFLPQLRKGLWEWQQKRRGRSPSDLDKHLLLPSYQTGPFQAIPSKPQLCFPQTMRQGGAGITFPKIPQQPEEAAPFPPCLREASFSCSGAFVRPQQQDASSQPPLPHRMAQMPEQKLPGQRSRGGAGQQPGRAARPPPQGSCAVTSDHVRSTGVPIGPDNLLAAARCCGDFPFVCKTRPAPQLCGRCAPAWLHGADKQTGGAPWNSPARGPSGCVGKWSIEERRQRSL